MDVLHEFIVDYLLNICGGLFLAIAVVIYRANKLRPANRAFSLLVMTGGLWTINYGFITRGGDTAIMHLRIGASIAAFLAPTIVFVREFIAYPRSRFGHVLRRHMHWVIVAVALAWLTTLDAFLHQDSPGHAPQYGPAWFWQHILISLVMAWIAYSGWRHMRAMDRGTREEMGIAVTYGAGAVALISAFLAFHKTGDPLPPAWFGLIAIAYAFRLTWTLLARGVYDARVLASILARTASVLAGASLVFLLASGLLERAGLNETAAAVIASLLAAVLVNYLTQFFLGRHNALLYRSIAGFQGAVNEVARSALSPEKAAQRLEEIIAEYTNTADAFILTEVARGIYQRGPMRLRDHGLAWQQINRANWLARDTMDLGSLEPHEREQLRWIDDRHVSLLMLSPRSTHHLNLAIALGRRDNAPAYTFYELECLSLMVESAAGALTTIEAGTQAQHAGQMMALGLISASVAHEIKQPLAALRLFLKMLPERCDDPRFRQEYFDVIPQELARMESTLSEFLRLGRTESYNIRAFQPLTLIREVLTLVQSQAAAQSIRVVTDFGCGDRAIKADSIVLKQALLNLVLNAIQAMSDERVTNRELYLGTALIEGSFEITIRDTGPGISPTILEKLFRPFVSTKDDGFGLGLYITRDQVVKTGGDLIAKNLPGSGACFTLLFPLVTMDSHALYPAGAIKAK